MFRRARDLRVRWEAAQDAELAFWLSWRSITTFQNFDPAAYWRRRFQKMGLTVAAVQSQTIVEVGCGPLGGIFHLPPAARKVGLDPLAGRFELQEGLSGAAEGADVNVLRAVGEQLPLRDHCADAVICYNVLDHVMTPEAVLEEIRRILLPGAPLFLMSHTFPAPLCPFLGFDKPHPHHWSVGRLLRIVKSHGFQVEVCEEEAIGFPVTWRTFFDPRAWKHLAANLLVGSTYLTVRPVNFQH